MRWCSEDTAAEQSDLRLLIRRKRKRGVEVWNRAGDQPAIVSPREGDVRFELLESIELVLNLSCLLERLIVVYSEDAFRQIRIEEQTTGLGREVARSCVPCYKECRQAFVLCETNSNRNSIKLRLIP